MTDPIFIEGTFADLKSVKTRSVVQMVVEVPIERAAQIVRLFGFPQPGAEIPVTVFRHEQAVPAPQKPAGEPKPEKPRRHFHSLPRSQQAALACQSVAFQRWLGVTDVTVPDKMLKRRLFIESKRQLDEPDEPDCANPFARAWDVLYADFEAETGRTTEAR